MNRYTEYHFGDMILRYECDEQKYVGLVMYPADKPITESEEKRAKTDALIQVKLVGDTYMGCFAPGTTLRQSESVSRLVLKEQKLKEVEKRKYIRTVLEDARGYEAVHTVSWEKDDRFVRMHCEYINHSDTAIKLELLTSFSLTGISPYLPGDCSGDIMVHRLQSRWSQEGRLLTQTIEELQLESSWGLESVRGERFGQVGSAPVSSGVSLFSVFSYRRY